MTATARVPYGFMEIRARARGLPLVRHRGRLVVDHNGVDGQGGPLDPIDPPLLLHPCPTGTCRRLLSRPDRHDCPGPVS